MASSKVFALFALLALCAASASATCSSYLPPMMQPLPLTMFQQQYRTMMQGIMSPQCHCGAMCSMTQMPLQLAMMLGMMAPQCQCGAMCQMAMQHPYMYNAAAMVSPTACGQQFVAGCGC
ncbi:unnamed protein product [Urochloa decumbens]|uniref:Bifunctional inhibitor/plant lipid transfer protein/seed storage helical domain-containing protein n=1 Tax=Urochloa decumbens TaxID=240449 RepID=A0ABC8Y069_9POAL